MPAFNTYRRVYEQLALGDFSAGQRWLLFRADPNPGHIRIIMGGPGNDTYIVDNSLVRIIEVLHGGVDTVKSSVSYELGKHLENLTLTGNAPIDGTGNDLDNVIIGNSAGNRLFGSGGKDILSGGAGADRMAGGAGNDSYIVENPLDAVIEAAGAGVDGVESSVTYTLPAEVENLTLTGASNINGTGNALNNLLTGNSGINVLDGRGGADQMHGGAGNDVYVVDHVGDRAIEASAGGDGDYVLSSVSFTLGPNLETLQLTGAGDINGSGNALDNVIYGNDGRNILDGGGGADDLIGGRGDDTYILDDPLDWVGEFGSGGIDAIFVPFSYSLASVANVENLSLTGSGNINGTGNFSANAIAGNSGNNLLDGGFGSDTLIGRGGNDTYLYHSTLESSASLRDTIRGFDSGDRIDLHLIDAVAVSPLNDAFAFIGSAPFSNVSGQLRAYLAGVQWMVEGDTNGDGIADLVIAVTAADNHILAAADFIF